MDLKHLCDGVRDCENGSDESETSCEKKSQICSKVTFNKGCGKYFLTIITKINIIIVL